ncbi:MAG: TonB family protein [Pseudohongiellaceae bacterium]
MSVLIEMWMASGDRFLVNLLLQVSLVAVLGVVVAVRFRYQPALRYAILYPALLSLPLLLVMSLQFHTNKLPAFEVPAILSLGSSTDTAAIFDLGLSDASKLELPFLGLDSEALSIGMPTVMTNGLKSSSEGLTVSIAVATLFLVLWLIGVLVALFGLVKSHRSIQITLSQSLTPSEKESGRLTSLLNTLELGDSAKKLQFRISYSVDGPMLTGILNPMILLPPRFIEGLSDGQLSCVLLHEIAHLQRNDVASNYLQQIVCSLFWFHPGVTAMGQQISRAREEICDNYVLQQKDPVSYSEVLLELSVRSRSISEQDSVSRTVLMGSERGKFTLGMSNKGWTLEERVRDLITEKRKTQMKTKKSASKIIQVTALSFSLFLAACQFSGTAPTSTSELVTGMTEERESHQNQAQILTADSQEETVNEPVLIPVQAPPQTGSRTPPQARPTETLSDEILQIVEEIQGLLTSEDEPAEPKLAEAKRLLDGLTGDRYESLNDFEKQTALNFLTNYHLMKEDYPSATGTFERILTIENVRAEVRLRTLRSLGQLHAALEDWQTSNDYYNQWRDIAAFEDKVVYKGLSYNHYQLEHWQEATTQWENYMALSRSEGETLTRDDYAYLNGLYYSADELDKALNNVKEMILLFNNETDWKNLRSLYSMLDAKAQAEMDEDELLGQLQQTVRDPSIIRTSLTPEDGDYLPLIAVAPLYPMRAANEGVEGWTLVEFTVREDGRVDEQSVEVVDAQPPEIFDVTSVRATKDFEFQPRVKDGKPVAVPGVQYVFRFQLEEDV